jgi:catalase (peroxidase I)
MVLSIKSTTLIACVSSAYSLCPFGFGNTAPSYAAPAAVIPSTSHAGTGNSPSSYNAWLDGMDTAPIIPPAQPTPEYQDALKSLDIAAVQNDVKALLTDSQEFWPADYGNYGPFFIRLAWHCSGSYRSTDGRGGCSGGRQRFEPERSWEDNTNLDKARRLLGPIKEKYGLGLSWGDLMVLAGTTAVEAMGGPTLGICMGRVDDENGARSDDLGPTPIQEKFAPCDDPGNCSAPLGTTTVGLIYVNPEGPMGVPLPQESALEVRDTFGRMGMDDRETVALIGGGHSFGKTHGACSAGPGLAPDETEAMGLNPDTQAWKGLCGTGKGADTFTSGIEGPWTSNPTVWDNDYFKNLMKHDWEVHTGPGGHHQWRVADEEERNTWEAKAPGASGGVENIMMLTSDIALKEDPTYLPIVKEFAEDPSKLDEAFAAAWHKLTTRAFGAQASPRCFTPAKKTKTSLRSGAKKPMESTCSATEKRTDTEKHV